MLKVLSIDELTAQEIEKAKEYLKNKTQAGPIEGLYWLLLPAEKLTSEQRQLSPDNGPYKIAIELGRTWLRFEVLVRSGSLDNFGGGICNLVQFEYLLSFYDNVYNYLNSID
jgi:hypothetical protein